MSSLEGKEPIITAAEESQYWRNHVMTAPGFRPDVEWNVTMFLDGDRVLSHRIESDGAGTWVAPHLREILRAALIAGANGIVWLHNHPVGGPVSPSDPDYGHLQFVTAAMKTLGLEVVDYAVLSSDGSQVFSFLERGLLEIQERASQANVEDFYQQAWKTVVGKLVHDNNWLLSLLSESAENAGSDIEAFLSNLFHRAVEDYFNVKPVEDRRLALAAALHARSPDLVFAVIDAARRVGVPVSEFVWSEALAALAAKFGSGKPLKENLGALADVGVPVGS